MSDEKQKHTPPVEQFYKVISEATKNCYFHHTKAKWVTWRMLYPTDFGYVFDNILYDLPYPSSDGMLIYGFPVEVNSSLPNRVCELWHNDELIATFTLPEPKEIPIIPDEKPGIGTYRKSYR